MTARQQSATMSALPPSRPPRLLLFYHFFHPDEVVSARQYSDFAQEQTSRGWQVTVVTSNRGCHERGIDLPRRETWRGVDVRRVFRPDWPQSRAVPRLGNSVWMVGAWLLAALRLPPADVVVIGSDPAFALLMAVPLRRLRPRTAIVHWCFDLYPEAIAADSQTVAPPLIATARALMARAYHQCDAVVDLGPTMRSLLEGYGGGVRRETLVPWALTEPARLPVADPAIRSLLFGDARLGLLYSGTMGRAHDFEAMLRLARACRARSGRAISFCFACRGNRTEQLRQGLRPDDDNVTLAPFAAEAQLESRLAAADLHLVSLRPEWAGVVVPSKFFASLAMGRPVVYAGPSQSEIARWVREFDVGFHLGEDPEDLRRAVDRLHEFIAAPAALTRWQERARQAYFTHFSRRVTNDRWNVLLRDVVAARQSSGTIPVR